MIERNERNNCELFGTVSDPCERNERNTPLGGVTVVRGVEMVPMPPFLSGGRGAVWGYAFALRSEDATDINTNKSANYAKHTGQNCHNNRDVPLSCCGSSIQFHLSQRCYLILYQVFAGHVYAGCLLPEIKFRLPAKVFLQVTLGDRGFAALIIQNVIESFVWHNAVISNPLETVA